MAGTLNFLWTGLVFVLVLGSGFWLSRLGKPLNPLLFNVHKLIALGCVVLAGLQFARTLNAVPPQGLVIGLLVVAAGCVLALFVSGALMSVGRLNPTALLAVHRIAPPVLLVASVLVVLLSRAQA